MSLRKRFIFIFGLGSVFFLGLIFVLIFYKVEEVMTVQLSKQFEVDAKQKAMVLNDQLYNLNNNFSNMSDLPIFKGMRFNQLTLNEAAYKDDIRQLELYFFELVKDRDELTEVIYIDQKAKEVFHVRKNKIHTKLHDLAFSKDIKQKLNLQKSDVYKTLHYEDGALSHVSFWVPVYVSSFTKQGVLGFSVNAKYFKHIIQEMSTFESESICLFDDKSKLILSNKDLSECQIKDNFWSLTQKIDKETLNWELLISVDPKVFLEEIENLQNIILMFIIPIIFLAIFFFARFINKILQVIEKLELASFAIGRGETIIEIGIDRDDELGSLAKSLQKSSQMIVSKTELEAVNNDLEAYSYTLAHDLRAPLRSISSFTQILEMDCVDKLNNDDKDILNRIIKASKRMSNLIDDILELSRVSKCEIEQTDVDMSIMAKNIISQLQKNNVHENSIKIQEHMNVKGDAKLIQMILENLLGNAWKYSSKNEIIEIEFSSYEDKADLVYKVIDKGAGFDMKYVNKLFKPFQRLHKNNEFEGTGIGLASVKRMLERHNGKIWIESQENKGTSVYFTIGNI